MTYCIYHIPGVKIGVTNNVKNRVEEQQGYEPDEYEILEMSDDIDYISKRELYLQERYGYKVDEQLYKEIFNNNFIELNNMNVNVTDMTSTFPCPVNKLKGQLMDNIGKSWKTNYGDVMITESSIKWILNNVKPSQYTAGRCYVYNKAFARWFDNNDPHKQTIKLAGADELDKINAKLFPKSKDCTTACDDCGEEIFECIRMWADERGLYDKGDPKTQYIKLMEETGEIGRAILKEDHDEIVDGIGDAVVVLTNLAELIGVPIEECIQSAYNVIAKRKGKMINGTFVKEEPMTSWGRMKSRKTL
jgi:NTP pyrophosphatase (non-canonical NTP hydrolase)|tara:strand:+ start:357 stop:1268 length:912 start_codon:yes stop_codon:yes gene_type:complete